MHLAKNGILVFLSVFFVCSAAYSGAITGSVAKGETVTSLSGVVVKACPEGRAFCTAVVSEQDGRFRINDLSEGLYSVFLGASRSSRPQVVSVAVPLEGQTQVDFRVGPSVEVEGDSWVQPYPVFYQSFQATGLGITNLVLKGYGPERAVHVHILEGEGLAGKQIGPSRRTIPFGGESEAVVFWSGGEIPTTPGKKYTLKLIADKAMTWIPAIAGRGNVYPFGQAYFGSEARPLSDLCFMLGEENDNLSVSYALAEGRRAIFVRAVGQTFTARSNDILFASACLERGTPQASYVRFSIHKDGPNGKQIGPSKGTSIEPEASVAWLPGEVVITPGRKYYLHIESFDGSRFYAFEESNPYAQGTVFNDGVKDNRYDLAGWVCGSLSEQAQAKLLSHFKSVKSINLVNPSFEQDTYGWSRTNEIGSAVGCEEGIIPAWGKVMFGWTNRNRGENSRTIIFQNVKVTPTKRYCFSGSVYTDHRGGRSSDQRIRLVVDTMGRGQFSNPTMESSQWYATDGKWCRGSVEFTAKSSVLTVGFEFEQRWALDMCNLYVDGAHLDQLMED